MDKTPDLREQIYVSQRFRFFTFK